MLDRRVNHRPRQMTGSPSFTKNPIDITFTP